MSELAKLEIKYLKGVGPKKADILKSELKVENLEDMLYVFPFRYIDRSKFYKISQIDSNMAYVQIKGTLQSLRTAGEGKSSRISGIFSDGESTIELVWFKGVKYIADQLKIGHEYVLFGKPNFYNGQINFVHPELESANSAEAKRTLGGLQGVYNTTEKMKNNFLTTKGVQNIIINIMQTHMANYQLPETLPNYLLEKLKLPTLDTCIRNLHFPKDKQLLEKCQFRMKFEELFYIQLQLLRRNLLQSKKAGFAFTTIGRYFNTFFRDYIPFELTGAQKRVIKEVWADMKGGKQMNRLLQGDVGSGKTLVAVMCSLMALDNNFQACIMAPTEILATQHYASISQMLKPLSIQVRLLTGSTRTAERREIHENLENGTVQLLIGTHALLEDKVKFHNLGLAIIDEQHRFGVAQRAKLWAKNICPPHVLVMTATPIPRTLAMTLYGDLDVSVIDELPPGRQPIKTIHRTETNRLGIYDFVKKEIAKGRQAYIVYPLIKESEALDFQNLEAGYQQLKGIFPEPQYHISMVHGQLPAAEKEEEMQKFVSGQTQILVATTVIEVGVNVPNASVMIIESAERFGLSQLHQLRGRVGRGAEQSYCILITSNKQAKNTRERMEIMTTSTDGFEISEADLRLRGPGDLEGTQQSGMPFELHIADLARDGQVLQVARDTARLILNNDPDLSTNENFILKEQLQKKAPAVDWGSIS
ncbi:MAG: ATP-dependent DNA helicase RecG [Paludibacteraceae bacterium]|nr:ATP-dependent DNA helicase RecG [Paludibacteraceae bacterium]